MVINDQFGAIGDHSDRNTSDRNQRSTGRIDSHSFALRCGRKACPQLLSLGDLLLLRDDVEDGRAVDWVRGRQGAGGVVQAAVDRGAARKRDEGSEDEKGLIDGRLPPTTSQATPGLVSWSPSHSKSGPLESQQSQTGGVDFSASKRPLGTPIRVSFGSLRLYP